MFGFIRLNNKLEGSCIKRKFSGQLFQVRYMQVEQPEFFFCVDGKVNFLMWMYLWNWGCGLGVHARKVGAIEQLY